MEEEEVGRAGVGREEALLASALQLFAPDQPALGDVTDDGDADPARLVYGVTDAAGRAQLRAELDGLIAHLYGLSHDEFAHILASFPLVADSVKTAALQAYRDVSQGLVK